MNYYIKKDTLLNFFGSFLFAFGAIWLLIEFPSSVNSTIKSFFEKAGNATLIFSTIIAFIAGLIRVCPKRRIIKKFKASNTSIEIVVGDIFKEQGNIVIGSSNYFDTELPIANQSLKGQLITTFFDSDSLKLDALIEKSIIEQSIQGIHDPLKISGKQQKFPGGTTARIFHKERQIFILIMSELFNENGRKHTTSNPQLLNVSLSRFWSFLKTEGRMKQITMPVLGSGLSRINLSYRLLVQLIILSFVTYSKSERITERLKIVVYKDHYNPEDFKELNRFLNSIEI